MKKILISGVLTALMCLCVTVFAENVSYAVEKKWVNVTGTSGDTNPADSENAKAGIKVTLDNGINAENLDSITALYGENDELAGIFKGAVNNNSAEYTVTLPKNVKRVKMFLWDSKIQQSAAPVKSYSIDEYEKDIYYSVPELEYTGKYLKRATFETDTLEMFNSDSYQHLSADCVRTDEITANSGRYCLKIGGRTTGSNTLAAVLNGVDYSSAKINVSCYVHNIAGSDGQSYSIQACIPDASGKIWRDISSVVTVTDDSWAKVEGTLDCSKYNLTEVPYVQIITRYGSTQDFYMDDFKVEADCDGEFYDDLNYSPVQKESTVSDTPNTIIPSYSSIEEDIPELKNVYREYFKVGAAICDGVYSDTNRYNRLIKKHFNSAVGESAFKMQNIIKDANDKTSYDFSRGDQFMDFCRRNGIEDIVGHCLVWDISSAVKYLKNADGSTMSRDTALSFMKEYITKVMRHFEGDGDPSEYISGIDYSDWHVDAWDVVNEAASEYTSDGYKTSGGSWINAVGKDYVEYAYKYAAETGYDMDFRYNDYDEHIAEKRNATYNIVKNLKDKGLRVDTIGMQSHYTADTNPSAVKAAIDKFTSLGVKVDVSEIDISSYTRDQKNAQVRIYENGVKKDAEYNQTRLYGDLADIYKAYSDSIDRVTLWTISDRLSATNGSGSGAGFYKTDYAGIFDRNYRSKPQFWAIADKSELYRRYPEYSTRTKLEWTFEDNQSEDVSTNRSLTLGKWTGYNNARTNSHLDWSDPAYTLLSDAAEVSGIVDGEDTGSSEKCIAVYIPSKETSSSNPPQAFGIRVKLSREQIAEGMTYKLNFRSMNNKYRNKLYACFRKPNDPENLANWISNDGKTSAVPWLADDGSDAIGESSFGWKSFSAKITPDADDFDECGYTTLWIIARPSAIKDSSGKYYQIAREESIFFDDISLEMLPEWTFEDSVSSGVSQSYDLEYGKWTGQYLTENNKHRQYMQPRYVAMEDVYYVNPLKETPAKNENPPPVEGSTKCMGLWCPSRAISDASIPQTMSVRTKLSKESLNNAESLHISFYAKVNTSENAVYACLRQPDDPAFIANWTSTDGKTSAVPFISDDASASVGTIKNEWKMYETDIAVTDDVFDENGDTVLWLITRPRSVKSSEGKYWQLTPGQWLYFDNISIETN